MQDLFWGLQILLALDAVQKGSLLIPNQFPVSNIQPDIMAIEPFPSDDHVMLTQVGNQEGLV